MCKFHKYTNTILVEKLDKKQINEVLKDDSILICCEFDYISYDLLSQDDYGYQEAYESWEEYKEAIKSFGVIYEKSLKDKFDIETLIKMNEEFIKEYQSILLSLRNDEEIVPITKSRKINEFRDNISECRVRINDLYEQLEVKEDEQNNITLPSIDINPYIKYMGEDSIKEFDPIVWVLEGFTDTNFIQEPIINEELDIIDFSDLEFINDCKIDRIDTIGKGGVKITLPAYQLSDAIKYIEQLCEWIENGNGETNDNCIFRLLMMREDDKINREFYLTESNYSKKVNNLLDILSKEACNL